MDARYGTIAELVFQMYTIDMRREFHLCSNCPISMHSTYSTVGTYMNSRCMSMV